MRWHKTKTLSVTNQGELTYLNKSIPEVVQKKFRVTLLFNNLEKQLRIMVFAE